MIQCGFVVGEYVPCRSITVGPGEADLRATAHHEAGHAVATRLWFRRAFKSVTIEGDEDFAGPLVGNMPGEWFQPEYASLDGRVRVESIKKSGSCGQVLSLMRASLGKFDDAGTGVLRLAHEHAVTAMEADAAETVAKLIMGRDR
jgi:hypothetical protein